MVVSVESADVEIIHREILPFLAPSIRNLMLSSPANEWKGLEEIRLRVGQPLILRMWDKELSLSSSGHMETNILRGYIVNPEDIHRTISSISDNSLYAFEEEIRRGYITVPGGHRVGLAGQVLMRQGEVKTMRDFSSIAFRVAREIRGCAREIIPYLYDRSGQTVNTLLVSAPRCGKTTILRDIARNLSMGTAWGKPCNVAVIDERSEIAGTYHGQVQMDLGPRTDVLDACPKDQGIMMALRSLSPMVIIADEIGRPEDVQAIHECVNAGVRLVTSIHAGTLDELKRRPVIRTLMEEGAFQNIFILSRKKGPGTLEEMVRCET